MEKLDASSEHRKLSFENGYINVVGVGFFDWLQRKL